MDTVIDTLYTVSLVDFPALPLIERMAAEMRYGAALEKALGSPEGVAKAYGAWCVAADSDATEITTDEANLAQTWLRAVDLARTAGLRNLGDAEGGYFEVRLE